MSGRTCPLGVPRGRLIGWRVPTGVAGRRPPGRLALLAEPSEGPAHGGLGRADRGGDLGDREGPFGEGDGHAPADARAGEEIGRLGQVGVGHPDGGVELADDVEVRVWDSTAELRYLVLPERPPGTEGLTEDELAALVTRDAMVGVALVKPPETPR
jgi:hypothetical protein